MKQRELILQLINEISGAILQNEPSRMVVSLHQEPGGLHICVIDDVAHSDEEIQQMEKALHSRKRPELAGYYGSMAGHDLLGASRLNLLGWQIKESRVSKVGGGIDGIQVDIWLGGKDFDGSQFSLHNKNAGRKDSGDSKGNL